MQRKERFLTAVKRGQPDRVPMFDFLFQQPLFQALIGHSPKSYNAEDAVKCALALNHDAVWIPFGGFSGYEPRYLTENVYVDEWGTTYEKNFASWPIDAPIDYPIKSREDLAHYTPPDPSLPGRDLEIRKAINMDKDDIAITGGIGGPFTTAWLLMGYERISYLIYDDPGMVEAVFKISNDFFKEAARLSVEAGCEAIWVSDDHGDSQRGFLRPELYKRHLLPYFADLVEYVDSLGVPALLHSCGHIKEYLDDIAQTKIASVHPLQRTAGMELGWFKEVYGGRFCIIGNIDSSRTLPFGTPDQVEEEVKQAIATAAPGGGYVLASDHSLHDGIPVENILRMFEVGAEFGKDIYSSE